MRKLLSLSTLLLVTTVLFTLTGCEKEQEITPQDIASEGVSDEYFYTAIEGFVTLPEGVVLSNKVKEIILEGVDGDPELMRYKGLHMEYSHEDILRLEEEGELISEGNARMLKLMGIDPNQSEEAIIEQVEAQEKEAMQKNGPYSNNSGLTYVHHYYEFDANENPNRYYWCGHANLKGVAKKHGQFKTLGQIHTAFRNNSSAYRNGRCGNSAPFCASLLDLHYAADNNPSRSWNYNLRATSYETVYSVANLFQRIKDGVDYNKPLIIPSDFGYSNVGHFYTVVGYSIRYSSGNRIDYNRSEVYLRDVARPRVSTFYDRSTSASNFFNKMRGNQVLIVRP